MSNHFTEKLISRGRAEKHKSSVRSEALGHAGLTVLALSSTKSEYALFKNNFKKQGCQFSDKNFSSCLLEIL